MIFSIYSVFFSSFIRGYISNRVFCFFTCRFLAKGQNALIELQTQRPVALELYKDFKELGRFMLRYSGSTIAAGVVTEVWHLHNRLSALQRNYVMVKTCLTPSSPKSDFFSAKKETVLQQDAKQTWDSV